MTCGPRARAGGVELALTGRARAGRGGRATASKSVLESRPQRDRVPRRASGRARARSCGSQPVEWLGHDPSAGQRTRRRSRFARENLHAVLHDEGEGNGSRVSPSCRRSSSLTTERSSSRTRPRARAFSSGCLFRAPPPNRRKNGSDVRRPLPDLLPPVTARRSTTCLPQAQESLININLRNRIRGSDRCRANTWSPDCNRGLDVMTNLNRRCALPGRRLRWLSAH